MRNQSIRGIVLRKRNIGENDQIVTIYSPPFGKFEASVKGSRKITSHFGGHLEILNICDFGVYSNGNRHTLTQCQCVNSFQYLKNDLGLAMLTFQIAEIFYRMTPSDGHGEDLFILLVKTLTALDCEKKSLIMESFKIKLLNAAGALPEISECAECGKKWEDDNTILMDNDGRMTCRSCAPFSANHEQISYNMIKLLKYLLRTDYEHIKKINLSPKDQNCLKKISDILLHSYINHELKSEKIANRVLV